MFQHTAARRRLASLVISNGIPIDVSTHSRPKAAGRQNVQFSPSIVFQHTAARRRLDAYHVCRAVGVVCFNTQPPEGGWAKNSCPLYLPDGFNTQPPEGGWENPPNITFKASGFNTQPPEGGWQRYSYRHWQWTVSTHSRPKAAGLALQPL